MAKQEIKVKNVPAPTKLFSRGISISNPKKTDLPFPTRVP